MLREPIEQRPSGFVKPIEIADKYDEVIVFSETTRVAQNSIQLRWA